MGMTSGRWKGRVGWVVAAAIASPLLGTQPEGAEAQEIPPPPPARTVAATDTTAAGVVSDPYRWLEDTTEPAVRTWYRAQRHRTDAVLRAGGEFDDLRDRLHDLLNDDISLSPVEAGGLLFHERVVTDASGSPAAYVVEVRAGPDAPPQRLLDPRDVAPGASWNRFSDVVPSPDGRRLLVGLPDGEGGATLRVYDRIRASFLPAVDHDAVAGTASWWPDGRSLLFTRPADGPRSGDSGAPGEVVRATLDGHATVLFEADGPGPLEAATSSDGRWLVVSRRDPATPPSPWPGYQGPSGEKPTWVGVAPLRDGEPGEPSDLGDLGDLRPLLPHRDARYRFLGTTADEAFFRTAPDDGFGRIVAVRLAGDRFGEARTVFAVERPDPGDARSGAERMVAAALVDGGVAVGLDRGLDGRILVVGHDGAVRREIRPPEPGPVSGLRASADGHRLFFRWGSFLRRQPVAWVDVATGDGRGGRGVFAPVGPSLDPDGYEVRRTEYASADGTRVPIFVAHRRDAPRDGTTPLLLYAYGGWGWSVGPWYHQRFATWLEEGGAVAIANVRGGGEHGLPWHEAGKLARRRNAVDDLQAAARWLVSEGYTAHDRLGLLGLSAGAPTVGSALLRAPELFGAAILEVGLLDLVRFGVAREFGDPADPEGAEAAVAFSPYHQIQRETCLPPVLVVTSEDDNLFPQALKTTARLQAAQRCEDPVLLHVGATEGHLPTGWAGAERHLNELLFLRRTLGRPDGTRRSPVP